MPIEGSSRHCSKVGRGVEAGEGEVHDLVRLDPTVVDALEPLQVDDQDGRKPPDLELLDCELVGLAGRAVILLVLPQFFLLGEGLQTFCQGDRLSSSTSACDHTGVFNPGTLRCCQVAQVECSGVPI